MIGTFLAEETVVLGTATLVVSPRSFSADKEISVTKQY